MKIDANTKIAAIIKQQPAALEAIVSISPKFEKLRNPILRKLIAGRTSIAMAGKIGGCGVDDFFSRLEALGFEVDRAVDAEVHAAKPVPAFVSSLDQTKIVSLDVRPVIDSGDDPLKMILRSLKGLRKGQTLKIVNSFEPTPLMMLLEKQGYQSYADVLDENLVETYFYQEQEVNTEDPHISDDGWDAWQEKYEGHIKSVDVRTLPMPMPMMIILEALEKLPVNTALFVQHKRIPVFLLPELRDRKFDYRIKEISEGEVHLLIFKTE